MPGLAMPGPSVVDWWEASVDLASIVSWFRMETAPTSKVA